MEAYERFIAEVIAPGWARLARADAQFGERLAGSCEPAPRRGCALRLGLGWRVGRGGRAGKQRERAQAGQQWG